MAADSVVKVEPACPNIGTQPKTMQWITDNITVSYDPRAKTATLHKPAAMTLHLASVGSSTYAPAYLKANVNLEDAQRLVDEAANLYAPFVEESTFQTNLRDDIRGQMFTGERVGRRRLLVGVWCGACVVELPSLLAFQQSHPHVSVLAVAITDKPSQVEEFLRKKHLDQLHVAVISHLPSTFSEGIPTTAVVSPAGQLAFVHVGAPADLTAVLQKDLTQLQR